MGFFQLKSEIIRRSCVFLGEFWIGLRPWDDVQRRKNRGPWARGRKGLELAIPMNEEAGCLIPACMFVEASAS